MKKILPALTISTVILAVSLVAQDARGVIDAASKAMGTSNLQAVEYSAASGNTYSVGQAPGPGKPWPRFTVTKYTAPDQLQRAGDARADGAG